MSMSPILRTFPSSAPPAPFGPASLPQLFPRCPRGAAAVLSLVATDGFCRVSAAGEGQAPSLCVPVCRLLLACAAGGGGAAGSFPDLCPPALAVGTGGLQSLLPKTKQQIQSPQGLW